MEPRGLAMIVIVLSLSFLFPDHTLRIASHLLEAAGTYTRAISLRQEIGEEWNTSYTS